MTNLFRVITEIDYIDSISEKVVFYSFDKNEAIQFAEKMYAKLNSNKSDNDRPNLMPYHELFKYMNTKARPLGFMTYDVMVEEVPMSTELKSAKSNIVWTPSIEHVNSIFQSELAKLISTDLNITLSNEESLELQDIFIKNPELFREKNFYGVVKHSGEIIKLLEAEKLEAALVELESKLK